MPRFITAAFLTFCLFALAACTASQQTERGTLFDPDIHVWPHDISDVAVDADITYGTLDNGLRYALQANGRPENEASLRMIIRAGAKQETEATLGAAHYLEHMAFNGTQNVPEGEMVKSLERMGLAFGADTNASTSFTRTDYRLSLPEVDDETVDYTLFLLREIADKMLIEPDAVERERGIIKAEEARRQSPNVDAAKAYQKFVQPDALYNERPIAGTPKTLDAMTAADLRAYYETYYRPDRTLIVMVGDFDVAEMEAKIAAQFEDWTVDAPRPPEPDFGIGPQTGLSATVYSDPEIITTLRMVGTSEPTPYGDTVATRRAASVRNLANGIVRLRVQKRLQAPARPVLSLNLSAGPGEYVNSRSVSVTVKDGDWRAALDYAQAEIRTALKYGFDQSEVDELVANSRRSLTDSVNYAAKRSSRSLLGGIAGSFSGGNVRTTPAQQKERFEAIVSTITLDELEAAFAQMWDGGINRIWLQGADVEGVTEADILSAFEAANTKPISAPAKRRTTAFAYQDFGTPGTITTRDRVEDFDITRITFDNNVRLNLKKTDFEDGWIRMQVTVGEGWNAFPADQPALSTLAGSIASGGYEAHAASELSEIFAGKNVAVNLGIGSDRLVMSGSTNADDVLDQMRAWAGLITAPGYRPEWREKFLEGINASFHMIDSTPSGVAGRDLGRIWHDGDTRYGYRPMEEYQALTLSQVRTVMEPLMQNGAIEIGIVGDFDTDAMIDAVSKTFGALPDRKTEFDLLPDAFASVFPAPARVALTHSGKVDQGALYMAWPFERDWDLTRSREFTVLGTVLTNRMNDVIREEMGLAYSPSGGISFDRKTPGYAYASVSITADPKHFDAFEAAIKDIAADLRKGGITDDELTRAVKPILENLERGQRENGAWLGLVTRAQTEAYKLDWRRSRTDAFASMSAADLDDAAQGLFDPKGLHVVAIVSDKLADDG